MYLPYLKAFVHNEWWKEKKELKLKLSFIKHSQLKFGKLGLSISYKRQN